MISWSQSKPTWSLSKIISNLKRGNTGFGKSSVTYRIVEQGVSAAQKTAIQRALTTWGNVTGVTFKKTTSSSADITFRHNAVATPAWCDTLTSGSVMVKAVIEFNSGYWENLNTAKGGNFQGIMVHEIGHALGLEHPGPYNVHATESQRLYQQDSLQYTAMSYFQHPAPAIGFSRPAEPLLHDISTIQTLYGRNKAYNSGDTVYNWDKTDSVFQAAIWDTGGTDTIDGSDHSTSSRGVTIDLRAGRFSTIGGNDDGPFSNNVAIAYDVTLENATGGVGRDVLRGNGTRNTLQGGGGNDKLYGMAGNDKLYGEAGNDRLEGGSGTDTLEGGSGSDTYVFSGTWNRDVVRDDGGVLDFTDSTSSQLTRTQSGDDLIVTRGSNAVTVRDYYLNVGQWEIKTGVADDYAANTGTSGRVSVGGSTTGDIEKAGDKDWFRVSLVKGRRYQFDLKGGTNSDVTLRLRDASGNSLNFNDDISYTGNRNSRIVKTVNRSGYYYLEAGAYGSNTGTYTLSVTQVSSSARSLASNSRQGVPSRTSVWQQTLVYTGALNASTRSNAVVSPLTAALDKDWQKNLLAFARG